MLTTTVLAASGSGGGGANYSFLIILVVLAAGLFWMSNRTRKTQKKAQEFRNALTPGQEVMTASGMLGTIVEVEDDEITLESTPGVRSRWVRAAISRVVEPTAGATQAPATVDLDEQQPLGDDALEIPDDLSGLPEADGRKDGDEGPTSK